MVLVYDFGDLLMASSEQMRPFIIVPRPFTPSIRAVKPVLTRIYGSRCASCCSHALVYSPQGVIPPPTPIFTVLVMCSPVAYIHIYGPRYR